MSNLPIFYNWYECGLCNQPKICVSINVTANKGGETSNDFLCPDCIMELYKDVKGHLATSVSVTKTKLTRIK